MSEEDDSQKTEDPTEKKLRDAREKGQVAKSRELTHFVVLNIITIYTAAMFPYFLKDVINYLNIFIEQPHLYNVDIGNLGIIFKGIIKNVLIFALLPMVLIIIASLGSSFLQSSGFLLSTDSLSIKLDRISIIKGFGRIFSLKSFVEFIKSIFKIIIIGIAIYLATIPYIAKFKQLYLYDIKNIMQVKLEISLKVFLITLIIMGAIGILDYIYQKYEFLKSLRMSKQEIKEEMKQTEGSPEIKSKLRQIRNERARKRMMAAVPEADVIVTNPTHYSIALKYNPGSMPAPIVVAKGQDNIALKIREVAKENDIPIVENAPLARALYSSTNIDETIPLEHYKAVAEIISYVFDLKKKST